MELFAENDSDRLTFSDLDLGSPKKELLGIARKIS